MNKERKYYRSQNPTLEITSITTLYPTAQLLRAQAYPSRNILLRVTPMESKSIGGISIVKATLVFTGTLLVYDYMITFKREVKLVWMQKWTRGKAMFMLNRYLPFPDTFLVLCLRMRQNSTSECIFGFKAYTWLTLFGILVAEFILMMRTYALWALKRPVLIGLATMGLALYTPAIFITDLEVKSIRYVGTATGCIKTAPSRKVVFLLFVLLLISETVLFVMTMMKVWKIGRRSRLLVTMYRDGLIYYLYIFVISLTNMMVPLVASPDFWFVWITPQRVLHSLFGSRVLLHIWGEITPHEQVILTANVDRNMSFAEVRSGETGTQSELQADIETNPPT